MRLLARDASVLLKALEQLGNGTNTPAMISVDRPPEGPAISKLERGLEFSLLSLHFPKHLLLEPLDGKQSFGDRVEGEEVLGTARSFSKCSEDRVRGIDGLRAACCSDFVGARNTPACEKRQEQEIPLPGI